MDRGHDLSETLIPSVYEQDAQGHARSRRDLSKIFYSLCCRHGEKATQAGLMHAELHRPMQLP